MRPYSRVYATVNLDAVASNMKSILQAEGRRFESVNAHYKTESYEEIREAFFISYRFYTNFLYPFAL